jgi:hypothetical protein
MNMTTDERIRRMENRFNRFVNNHFKHLYLKTCRMEGRIDAIYKLIITAILIFTSGLFVSVLNLLKR